MKKQLAALGMSAALLGGGALGTVLMSPTTASAESSTASSTDTSTASSAKPGAWMSDALAKLVDAGTLTQSQSDAVAAALAAARPEGGPGGPGRAGGPGLDAAATALGVETSALRTQLQSGKTIADVAKANNVDISKVIDAIVADMNEHLAAAVSDGRLTQAEADQRKANATERATALVNGQRPDAPSGS
jgi:hypothetical protein